LLQAFSIIKEIREGNLQIIIDDKN
jgi:hypothetical protein